MSSMGIFPCLRTCKPPILSRTTFLGKWSGLLRIRSVAPEASGITILGSNGRWGLSGGGRSGPKEGSAYVQGYLGMSGHLVEGGAISRLVYVNRWGGPSRINGLVAEPSLFGRIGWKNLKLEGTYGWTRILKGPSFSTASQFSIGLHFYFGRQHGSKEEAPPSRDAPSILGGRDLVQEPFLKRSRPLSSHARKVLASGS